MKTADRQSLAKAIGATQYIGLKWLMAHTSSTFDLKRLIQEAVQFRWLSAKGAPTKRWQLDALINGLQLMQKYKKLGTESRCLYSFADVGKFFCERVTEKDHSFFDSLAGALQHETKYGPPHQYYKNILNFCLDTGSGTKDNPCDPHGLTAHLEKLGHHFSKNHDNEVPRSLRRTCKQLGIALKPLPRGRRKIGQR